MQSHAPVARPHEAALRGNNAVAVNMGLLLVRLALGGVLLYFAFCHLPLSGANRVTMRAGHFAAIGAGRASRGHWSIADVMALVAGAGLFIGLFSRISALTVLMAAWVDLYHVHGAHNALSTPLLIAIIALSSMVLLAGAGLVSFDAWLFRRSVWARGPQPLGEPSTPPTK